MEDEVHDHQDGDESGEGNPSPAGSLRELHPPSLPIRRAEVAAHQDGSRPWPPSLSQSVTRAPLSAQSPPLSSLTCEAVRVRRISSPVTEATSSSRSTRSFASRSRL